MTPAPAPAASPGLTREGARAALQEAVAHVVPAADLAEVPADADLRDWFELDSLDFVEIVERLSGIVGFRIEDHEAESLRTIGSATAFLLMRAHGTG
jgi:acyl carrier protein